MLQSLAELRGDAEGDGFPTGGTGGVLPQEAGLVLPVAVLGGKLLEYGGFVARVFREEGVDAVAEGFCFCTGLLPATIFEVGKVAHKAVLEAGYTEPPAVECAKLFIAPGYVLRRHAL